MEWSWWTQKKAVDSIDGAASMLIQVLQEECDMDLNENTGKTYQDDQWASQMNKNAPNQAWVMNVAHQ